jgi:flagellar hook-associated protein 2
VTIRNRNTHRDIVIRSLRIYDPAEAGGFKPSSPVSTARDAVIVLDGIEAKRESNSIPDLIPGVTLNLHEKTDKPVKLSVEPDRQASKDALTAWIWNYNQVMREFNILMSDNESVIQEMEGLSDADKEAALKRLGLLQGDFTVSNLKTQLQRITMNPYPTSLGNGLSLLHHMGISTNAQATGSSGIDPSRLRGYLEVDVRKLDDALASKMSAVKELFGNDSDGDIIVDTGVAYSMDSLMKPFVETGGIIAQKRQTLSSQMQRQKRSIETMEEQLSRKEADLRKKYGQMEGALDQMQKASKSLDSFNNKND